MIYVNVMFFLIGLAKLIIKTKNAKKYVNPSLTFEKF